LFFWSVRSPTSTDFRLESITLFYHGQFPRLILVLQAENEGRTEIHHQPDPRKQSKRGVLVHHTDHAVLVPLIEHLGTGQGTGAAGNTFLSLSNDTHGIVVFSFLPSEKSRSTGLLA
jgi:hypothetical protein